MSTCMMDECRQPATLEAPWRQTNEWKCMRVCRENRNMNGWKQSVPHGFGIAFI